jgi:hypothetical protein
VTVGITSSAPCRATRTATAAEPRLTPPPPA